MKIGVITKREKATKTGSVMQETIGLLNQRGIVVEQIYPEDQPINVAAVKPDCDLYLLKSGTETALSLAGVLHSAGAKILNPYPTVVAMRDKIISTRLLLDAGVPLPETYFTAHAGFLADALKDGPLVVKPFWAASQGRGVQIIHSDDELEGVTSDEGLVFAQRYHKPDGRDYKLYVIGEQVFGVRRVWPPKTLEDKLGKPFEVSGEMKEIALNCGRAFGVGLYGVDVIISNGQPFVVDINTFPGFKGVTNAAELLAAYITDEEAK
ncbi:MAG: RimK family alpha-L-glutamate ligase [Blastocatellales bacterium]